MFNFSRRKIKVIDQILQQQMQIFRDVKSFIKICEKQKSMQEFFCPNCKIFKLKCNVCFDSSRIQECNNHQKVNIKSFIQQQIRQYNYILRNFEQIERIQEQQKKAIQGQTILEQITEFHNQNQMLYKQFKSKNQLKKSNYLGELIKIQARKETKLKELKQKAIKSSDKKFLLKDNQKKFQQTLNTIINQIHTQIIQLKTQKLAEENRFRQWYFKSLINNIGQKTINEKWHTFIPSIQKKQSKDIQKLDELIKIRYDQELRINQLQKQLFLQSATIQQYQKTQKNKFAVFQNKIQVQQNQISLLQQVIQRHKKQILDADRIKSGIQTKFSQQKTNYQERIKLLEQLYVKQKLKQYHIEQDIRIQPEDTNLKNKQFVNLQKQNEQLKLELQEMHKQLNKISCQNKQIKQYFNIKSKQIIHLQQLIQELNDSIKQKNTNIQNLYKIIKNQQISKQVLEKDLQNVKIIVNNIIRYQKRHVVGEGGQAIIYECVDRESPQQKKILRVSPLGKECLNIQRTLQQPYILSRLNHPNIIKVEKYWQCDNYFRGYTKPIRSISMVMQYIETGDLQKYINNKRKFTFYDVVTIYQNIKSALQYLHHEKIIHRDVTRRNILIKEEKSIIMKAILTDFGICSVIQDSKANRFTKNSLATDYHRAPQLLQKSQISFAIDLWNLGIVMIEITLGTFIQDLRKKQPGLCIDFPQIELTLIHQKKQHRKFIPIIKKLLEKDPKLRKMIQV